jgi:uncharacterized protein
VEDTSAAFFILGGNSNFIEIYINELKLFLWSDEMKFEVYKDRKGEHRWRLRHGNGNILATSSEGYAAKASALKCIDNVREASNAANTVLKQIVEDYK